jgi:formamidopyrimidine-DNA glycosylase
MPELPDIEAYLSALSPRVLGRSLERVRLGNAFVLRSVDPPLTELFGLKVIGLRRLGKRIVFELDGDLYLALHLMIAGRLRWTPEVGAKLPGRVGISAFDFESGTLLLTEAGTKRRASLFVLCGRAALTTLDRGGIEPLESSLEQFSTVLRRERHTLKRTLTDPRLFAGIGNAYSDEILFAAQLSPMALSTSLDESEVARLHRATLAVLTAWSERLREEAKGSFPEKVTAFREGMTVHGRYRKPCLVCGSAIQRIAYADNEANYCARCQNEGRLLKDRALSRLLKEDWPKRIEELEESRPTLSAPRPRRA